MKSSRAILPWSYTLCVTFAAAIASMTLTVPSLHADVIQIDDINVFEGTQSVDISVRISGGTEIVDLVAGILLIGDAGAAFDGSSPIKVTDVSFANSIFQSVEADAGETVGGFDFVKSANFMLPSAIVDPEANLFFPNTNFVRAEGELFRLTVDTSSLVAGQSFAITMDTNELFGQAITFTKRDRSILTPTFAPGGSINIVSVPEPSLLYACTALGLVCLARRKRQCSISP